MYQLITHLSIKNHIVKIYGVNGSGLAKEINKVLGTTRFSNQVLIAGTISISFHEFFLPEMFFLVNLLLSQSKGSSYYSMRAYKLRKILQVLKEETWLKDIDSTHDHRLDLSKLDELAYPPLDYQQRFLEHYSTRVKALNLNGMLLDAAAGTGKTYTGLALAHCLHSDKVIIIAPLNSIHRVWEATIQSLFKTPQTHWTSKSNTLYRDQRFIVAHYESLKYVIEIVKQLAYKKQRITIILDESHNFNDPKSARTELFLELVKLSQSEDILFSSGTPIKALGTEAVPLLTAIDPLFTEEVSSAFRRVFGANVEMCGHMLRSRLGMISFKVEKKEADLEKPTIQDMVVKIPNEERFTLKTVKQTMDAFVKEREQYYDSRKNDDRKTFDRCIELYKATLNDRQSRAELENYLDDTKEIFKAWRQRRLKEVRDVIERSNKYERTKIIPALPSDLKPVFREVKTLIKYPGLKIQGECLGRILGGLRIECYTEMAKYVDYAPYIDNSIKKVVIFTSYTKVCEVVEEQTRKAGYAPIGVYGEFTKNLNKSVQLFEQDEAVNPLVTTYQSLSTAVPLTMANTMIMINQPFRSYIQEQAIARIWRKGADSALFVYQCLLDTGKEPNLSTRGIDIVEWSQKQVELLTGTESIFKEKSQISEDGKLTIANESYDIREEVTLPLNSHYLNRW